MLRRLPIPWLVLGASLLLTTAATLALGRTVAARDRAAFQAASEATGRGVAARLDAYVALLLGARALFASSEDVTRAEFETYVSRLGLQEVFPGIQGIGYAETLPEAGPAALEARMRPGLPDFRVWGEGDQPLRTAILYLAPMDARNRAAIGYDMASEPTRAAAMERAWRTNEPALTAGVTLKQEIDEDVQRGFLIYVPIYRDGMDPGTVEGRREALRGYVHAPFRAGDLFAGLRGDPRVSFEVYDGATVAPEHLLFDSRSRTERERRPLATTTRPLESYGHRWTLRFTTLPAFERTSDRGLVPLLALGGLAFSLVLFGATRTQERARERTEASEAARTRFFAAMSHELRTPINAIMGYNDLLLADVYGPLADKQKEGIERAQRAARHMAELVNDVLDLSKLAAGKLSVETEEVFLPELLDDLLTTVGPVAEERGCDFHLETSRCRTVVHTDPRRVRQIVLNLVSNATKFGAGKPVVLRCADHDGGVRVEVTDRGPGIPLEAQPRIFEEFVQLDREQVPAGTGLGLTISRSLTDLLGGSLEVDSEPGSGSTFRLWLPRHPPAAAPAEDAP